ncbi:four-carbon acid sugar kinase family protein, partial [Candidatus Symbiopectobacterium sp. NZEC135]|uniref:four-carbon acid sugar kinase family protein n=1 Tax=Candidatus Symbiopectobacterium sp. NZEC135 TaxID=2820471 RepID=UPI002227DCFE
AQAAQDAALRVVHAVTRWREAGGNGWVFKKIDSTLRGNLGAEIAAALTASGADMALIAPAVPALGRITRDGKVWVNGTLLTETEFASDPKTPVRSADIAERIAEQSALTTATLSVSENNHSALAAQLRRLRDAGIKGVIIDAETPQALALIVAAAQTLPVKPLLVGAAGLSDALAQALSFTPPPRPALLAVVGSMSEMTQKQIADAV